MENQETYKCDEKLLYLLNNVCDTYMRNTIIEILDNGNRLGYYNMDNTIMSMVEIQDVDNSDILPRITKSIRSLTIELLKNEGLGLYDNVSILDIKEILSGLVHIKDIEQDLKEGLLTIVENDTVEPTAMMSELLDNICNIGYVESYEILDFVQDKYIEALIKHLTPPSDIDIDNEDVGTNMNDLNVILTNTGELMKSTYIVSELSTNQHIEGTISDYYRIVDQYIDNGVVRDHKMLAAEIAAIIYVFKDTEETLIDIYIKWFENVLFDSINSTDSDIISGYVSEYIDIFNKNIKVKND